MKRARFSMMVPCSLFQGVSLLPVAILFFVFSTPFTAMCFSIPTKPMRLLRSSLPRPVPVLVHSSHHRCSNGWLPVLYCAVPNSAEEDDMASLNSPLPDRSETQIMPQSSSIEQDDRDPNDLGDIPIPSTGVSVTDELNQAQADKFFSEVVHVKGLPGVAQIVTIATGGSIENVRYLVALSPPARGAPENKTEVQVESSGNITTMETFCMIDVPAYSEQLVANMRKFMGSASTLAAILITSRDSIHYDEAPAVFTSRKSDLEKWTAAFPDVKIIAYRLDIPRDCRELVTQRLDGYGPWALEENGGLGNVTFVETGRPLTYMEWDDETAAGVFERGETPPDQEESRSDDDLYTPEAIRAREQNKRVLAIYTPGHTYGSVTYIFPQMQVCCSGFTIPVEDTRADENYGMGGAGPTMDSRGYITTSKAGMGRQMESARHIVNTYGERFTAVLPSLGDPLFLDGSVDERRESLLAIVDQYDKIGRIYEQLGVTSPDDFLNQVEKPRET